MFEKGHRGELQLDHYLNFFTTDPHFLIQGLRLRDNFGSFFQVDTLLLVRSYFCLFEVKNWSGTISFNPALKQATRKVQGEQEGCSDPISQVFLQRTHLLKWLQNHRFSTTIPIYPFVVISYPTTTIEIENNFKLIADHVFHAHAVLDHLKKLNDKMSTDFLDKKTLRKIGKAIVKHDVPKKEDVLKKYLINRNELITGVCCEACGCYSIIRSQGQWYCSSCRTSSKTAHKQALEDYSLLIGNTITNAEARWFLRVSSRNVVNYLCKDMKLLVSGKSKSSKYNLPNKYPYM